MLSGSVKKYRSGIGVKINSTLGGLVRISLGLVSSASILGGFSE